MKGLNRPKKEDYDFNDNIEGVRYAKDMNDYANKLEEQLRLYVISCSYIILYNNEEWDKFDGTLEQAIEYLKADSRYKDYGRNGATIFKGKDIYSIADKQTENIHI